MNTRRLSAVLRLSLPVFAGLYALVRLRTRQTDEAGRRNNLPDLLRRGRRIAEAGQEQPRLVGMALSRGRVPSEPE